MSYNGWLLTGPPLFLVLGTLIVALNIWVIVCVVRAKILAKNRFFSLILLLTASDIIVTINYMTIQAYFIPMYYYGQAPMPFSSGACYTYSLMFTVGDNAQELAMLAIAIERIYAVGWPIHYRINGRTAVTAMIIGVIVISGGIGLLGYLAFTSIDPTTMLPICIQPLAGNADFWVFWAEFRNGTFLLTLAIYIALPFVARRATKVAPCTSGPLSEQERRARQRQLQLTKMVVILATTYTLTTGVSLVLSTIISLFALDLITLLNLAQFVSILYCLNYLINVFVFPLKFEELRDAMIANLPAGCSDWFVRRAQTKKPVSVISINTAQSAV